MKKTFSFFVVSNKKIEINAFFPLQDRLLFCREKEEAAKFPLLLSCSRRHRRQ